MATVTEPVSGRAFTTEATETGEVRGEVISWEVEGVRVPFSAVQDALRAAGLGETLAREMLPVNALRRAVRKLLKRGVIRVVFRDKTMLRFQLTAERLVDGEELAYDRLAFVDLTLADAAIRSDDPGVEAEAKARFDEEIAHRNANDITAVVRRIVTDKKDASRDLIPIRKSGGVYFVRREALAFVEQVETFLDALGCSLTRFPVAAGTGSGDASIARHVTDYMDSLIDQYRKTLDDLDGDATDRKFAGAAKRAETLAFKLESYGAYLEGTRDSLAAKLDAAKAYQKERVAAIVRGRGDAGNPLTGSEGGGGSGGGVDTDAAPPAPRRTAQAPSDAGQASPAPSPEDARLTLQVDGMVERGLIDAADRDDYLAAALAAKGLKQTNLF